MNVIFKKIENIINEEVSLINQKINGTGFLEILKYKLIDKLFDKLKSESFSFDEDLIKNFIFEDINKKIETKLIICKSPNIRLNSQLESNMLLISIKDKIVLDIEDNNSKKYINFNILPFTGITIPRETNYKLSFLKNSVSLEILLEDKNFDIGKK